jgi:hypothetical protein
LAGRGSLSTGGVAAILGTAKPSPLVLEDCLQPEDDPSVASHEKALFIQFPTPFGLDEARPPYLSIVCLPTLLITVHQKSIPALDKLARDLTGKMHLTSVSLSSLLYRLMEAFVFQSATFVLAARHRLDRLAQVLDEEPDSIEVGNILALKRQVGQLSVTWDDELYCVAALEHVKSPVFSIDEDREYFHDLLENLRYGARFYSRLETRLKDMHFQYMLTLQDRSEKRLRLLTDNARFQLHRVHLAGARAGESEVLWRDLPGLADGMRRDSKGRIWLTIITNRGSQFTWAHANPEVKPFLMKYPQLVSLPPITSLLLLSPDASTPLWYTEHFQTRVNAIAAVTPGKSGLYLANFSDKTPGLHWIDNPVK